MANDKPGSDKSKSVKDLEGLSDEDLENVQGGNNPCGMSKPCGCVPQGGGGSGGCGSCKTEREANVIGKAGDVEMNPIKRDLGGIDGHVVKKR